MKLKKKHHDPLQINTLSSSLIARRPNLPQTVKCLYFHQDCYEEGVLVNLPRLCRRLGKSTSWLLYASLLHSGRRFAQAGKEDWWSGSHGTPTCLCRRCAFPRNNLFGSRGQGFRDSFGREANRFFPETFAFRNIDQCVLVTIPTMSNLLFLGLCNRSRAGPHHQI